MSVPALVLRESVTLDALHELARAREWTLAGEDERTHWLLRSVWWTSADGIRITYNEDHTADVRFVEVEGAGASACWPVLRDALPHYTADELLEQASRVEPCALIGILGRLAVLRPDAEDPRWLRVWSDAAHHRERGVRRAAIRTAYGCSWPGLVEVVSERIDNDVRLREAWQDLDRHLREAVQEEPG